MSDGSSGLAQLLAGLGGLAGEPVAPRLVGLGWATVDMERTLASLPGGLFQVGDIDELLGASSTRTTLGPVTVLLLEPVTEGRLAAALARHGEGIAVLYVATDDPLHGVTRQTALGLPGRLRPHDRPWGPFIIQVPMAQPIPGAPQADAGSMPPVIGPADPGATDPSAPDAPWSRRPDDHQP